MQRKEQFEDDAAEVLQRNRDLGYKMEMGLRDIYGIKWIMFLMLIFSILTFWTLMHLVGMV